MFVRLFLVFSAVSLLEIFVLVQVGGFLGVWPTIALVILSALVGSTLVRSQGLQLVQQLQQRLAKGEMPGQQLVEGCMLLITGILLVTPGFVTDLCGLLLLQPNIRSKIAHIILTNVKINPASMGTGYSNSQVFKKGHLDDRDIIEGEFERKDDDK